MVTGPTSPIESYINADAAKIARIVTLTILLHWSDENVKLTFF